MDTLKITNSAFVQILNTIGSHPTECGGVLGAGDDGVITDFYYDVTGRSTPNGYTPDVATINGILANDWMPRGVLMVGILHSHENGNIVPSCGDIEYGIRILQALDTVKCFYLPIVTKNNEQMRMDCYVVYHDEQHDFVCKKVGWEIVHR